MKTIDIETLNRNFNEDTEFIIEITKEYTKYAEVSIENLLNTYNRNDWKEMLNLVHSLKGSSKTIYAEEISEIFVKLENQLKEGKTKDLKQVISMILPAFNRLKKSIIQIHER